MAPPKLAELRKLRFDRRAGIKSSDLSEATYRMDYAVADRQVDFFEKILPGDQILRVFGSVFRAHRRQIDLSDVPQVRQNSVTSCRGMFMGDALSFAHLSTFLAQATIIANAKSGRCSYEEAVYNRPFGAITGDDAFFPLCSIEFSNEFNRVLIGCGGKLSKLDAFSPSVGTYTEQYYYSPTLLDVSPGENERLALLGKVSKFGNLRFLDTIKGSYFAKQAKVKSEGVSPFIGHALALGKVIGWHPDPETRRLSRLLLVCLNQDESRHVTRARAYLPRNLGGLDIPISEIPRLNDASGEKFSSTYLWPIVGVADGTASVRDAIFQDSVLTQIWAPSKKGVLFDPESESFRGIIDNVDLRDQRELILSAPNWVQESKNWRDRDQFLRDQGWIPIREQSQKIESVRSLSSLLSRDGVPFDKGKALRLSVVGGQHRFRAVWDQLIRDKPQRYAGVKDPKSFGSIEGFSKAFSDRHWFLSFQQDDPAIRRVLRGISTMSLSS